jgi:hypothetical protein
MSATHDDSGTVPPRRSERGVAELFIDLVRESSRLFRQEIALAHAELEAKLGQLGTGAVAMAVGGLIIYAGFLAVLLAAGLGLALLLQPWLAALIVGTVTIIVGTIIAFMGKRMFGSGTLVPERMLRSLRKDVECIRGQVR